MCCAIYRLVIAGGLVSQFAVASVLAAEPAKPEPIPNPLTLDQALSIAATSHPDLEIAEARVQSREAELTYSRSGRGLQVQFSALGQSVDPVTSNAITGDSQATLGVVMPLYDFGRTGNRVEAARAGLEGERIRLLDAQQRHRLNVMARFFDVLLADMRFQYETEVMTRRYLLYDRMRQRQTMGQKSELAVLELETRFRKARSKRIEAQSSQRATRARLAIAMNRPLDLADGLVRPELPQLKYRLPEYDEVVKKTLSQNPELLALEQDIKAEERQLRAAKAHQRPSLDLELEANAYERNLGLRNDTRAGIKFSWPIYRGGERGALVLKHTSTLRSLRARKAKLTNTIRQQTLEQVQKIEYLIAAREAEHLNLDYMDMKLDEARALYELEARASLGDAMIGVTEAQWHAARKDFELAIAWARLAAMSGEMGAIPRKKESKP